MTTRFDRDGLIDGLRQLVAKLHESDSPTDLLPDRAVRMVERILQVGLPEAPTAPPRPDFEG
ncbi:hypothetical protein JOE59_002359 [Agromyces cerinus]|uniref:hypothetical protein n=1 Tax=Agromyces cerinus TaxID=33878 RepID=UPI00195EAB03|nr:hypothetical protein [Agromyces cerinus]MBM7831654.1 hypothetical protein [Agromyces cerinus]